MQQVTGKTHLIAYGGRELLYCNQSSAEWTHPYSYMGSGDTLKSAGCGIFAIAHAVEWMSGQRIDCAALADFSVANGGRGDDGTDRPALLSAMMRSGLAAQMGFEYDFGGLRNDHELLWRHMSMSGNAALCNLRVGHIVALLAARTIGGHRQLLATDSVAESASEKFRNRVCECVEASEVSSLAKNANGMVVGRNDRFAMFWVEYDLPADFNLLRAI